MKILVLFLIVFISVASIACGDSSSSKNVDICTENGNECADNNNGKTVCSENKCIAEVINAETCTETGNECANNNNGKIICSENKCIEESINAKNCTVNGNECVNNNNNKVVCFQNICVEENAKTCDSDSDCEDNQMCTPIVKLCESSLPAKLHIELSWDISGDLNLHFKKFGTDDTAWGTGDDCHWRNCLRSSIRGVEWFEDDYKNPVINRDALTGTGPEILKIQKLHIKEGDFYTIGVENYKIVETPTATVKINCNGVDLVFNQSKTLATKGSFWWVTDIAFTKDGCVFRDRGELGDYPGTNK